MFSEEKSQLSAYAITPSYALQRIHIFQSTTKSLTVHNRDDTRYLHKGIPTKDGLSKEFTVTAVGQILHFLGLEYVYQTVPTPMSQMPKSLQINHIQHMGEALL